MRTNCHATWVSDVATWPASSCDFNREFRVGLADTGLDIKYRGAFEVADDGTLFVGDNTNGAICAFDLEAEPVEPPVVPSTIANIDARIAELLGVGSEAVEINDMAVHPNPGPLPHSK